MAELFGSMPGAVGAPYFCFPLDWACCVHARRLRAFEAGTKASTLGNILVLTGVAFYHPGWSLKLLIVIYFVSPHQSDFLARVGPRCHATRVPMTPRP